MVGNQGDLPSVSTIGGLQPATLVKLLRGLAEEDAARLKEIAPHVALTNSGLADLKVTIPGSNSGKKAVATFLDSALSLLESTGVKLNRQKVFGASKQSLDGHMPYDVAVAQFSFLALKSVADPDDPTSHPRQMVVSLGRDKPVLAGFLADTLRHGRDVTVSELRDGTSNDVLGYAAIGGDSAEERATLQQHMARFEADSSFFLLSEFSAGGRVFWTVVPPAMEPHPEALQNLAGFWDAVGIGEHEDSAPLSLVMLPERGGHLLMGWIDPSAQDAQALDTTLEITPVQPIDVSLVVIEGGPNVTDKLMRDVAELDPRIGYTISLRPQRRYMRHGADIEKLREQIDELQSYIDEAQIHGAPQRRLLRFSDAQLPAMIDTLRRMPPQALKNEANPDGVVQYAASHAQGRAGPVHYLLYDPADHVMRVTEHHWQTASDDKRPIAYWLEPYVAQAHEERREGISVFVPDGMFLVPSLVHFGGDVLQTLRLILGDLFFSLEPLTDVEDRDTAFIFTAPAGAPLELEALDMTAFQPLQQQLPWVNDYIQVRDPLTLDRGRLEELADALYEGDVAERALSDFSKRKEALTSAWDADLGRLRAEALELMDGLDAEMRATSDRIARGYEYLSNARREMRALERVLGAAERAVRGHQAVAEIIAEEDIAMREAQEQFAERIAQTTNRGQVEIQKVEVQIDRLRRRLDEFHGE